MEAFAFGNPTTTNQADGAGPTVYTLGTEWFASVAAPIVGGRWRAPDTVPSISCNMLLYRVSDQALLASSGAFTPTAGVENDVLFSSPFTSVIDEHYVTAVLTNRYTFSNPGGFPHTTTHLTAPAGVNGRFRIVTAGNPAFPDSIHPGGVGYQVGPLVETTVVTLPMLLAPPFAAISRAGSW